MKPTSGLEQETVLPSRSVTERIRNKLSLRRSTCIVTDKVELIKGGKKKMHTATSLFTILASFQITNCSQTCRLIFTPSNYCLPISNSQPVPYCFSLIVFWPFLIFGVRVPPEAEPPPPPNSSITERWYIGVRPEGWRDGGSEAQLGRSGLSQVEVIFFHSLHRDWWRVWLMFTCHSKTLSTVQRLECFIA